MREDLEPNETNREQFMRYGYARVSTADQRLEVQEEALKRAGCEVVRGEKLSGATPAEKRPQLQTLLDFLRQGDTLVVMKMDRLARSLDELLAIAKTLKVKGVAIETLDGAVDTKTAAGNAFFQMLGVFAEFETSLRRERQAEGIAKAKAAGIYKGRKRSVDRAEVARQHREGRGATEIARELGIGRASVYRALDELKAAESA